jgi:hypothetical protein
MIYPNKESTTEDKIITVLSTEWPLSVKQIYLAIKKRYGFKGTYQAIYNLIQSTKKEGILKRMGNDYQLNYEWVKDMSSFFRELEESQKQRTRPRFINEKTTQLTFPRLFDLIHFLLDSFENNFFDTNKKRVLVAHFSHLWFPFVLSKERKITINKLLQENKTVILCRNRNFIDRIVKRFYEAKKVKVILNVNVAHDYELIIHGNCIIQLFIPISLKKKIDKAYNLTRNIFNFTFIEELNEVLYKEINIPVLINRNETLASQIISRSVSGSY